MLDTEPHDVANAAAKASGELRSLCGLSERTHPHEAGVLDRRLGAMRVRSYLVASLASLLWARVNRSCCPLHRDSLLVSRSSFGSLILAVTAGAIIRFAKLGRGAISRLAALAIAPARPRPFGDSLLFPAGGRS